MREPSTTIEVRIEAPSGPARVYVADPESLAVRLSGTARDGGRYPAEWAIVPGSLTSQGQPLGALIVSDIPCSPGALAAVRLVGLLRVRDEGIAVGVLDADAAMGHVSSWQELEADTRAAIAALVSTDAGPGGVVSWFGPAEAAREVRDARQAARIARAEYHADRSRPPVWQAAPSRGTDAGPAYEEAEVALGRIPFRFQEYVGALLVEQERILAFAPRPRGQGGRVGLIGRGSREEEGLLVVTDQQVLWMADVLASPVDVTGYGYVARAVPLERLTAVRVDMPKGKRLRLVVDSCTARGSPWSLDVAFPHASGGIVREVASVLEAFLGDRSRASLMRLAHPPADEAPIGRAIETGDQRTMAAVGQWEGQLAELLAAGERIVAKGVLPAWAEHDGTPRLVVVTDRRLLVLSTGSPDAPPLSWRAAEIGAVALTYSVFESSLAFEWARGGEVVRERLVFPLVAARSFARVFVAIRRVMVGRHGFAALEGQ